MSLSEKGIIIRKTIEADLPQIYSIGKNETLLSELPYPLNSDNMAEIFSSLNCISFTAVRKKKVLGFIIGTVKDNQSRIHWMMVKENFRRAGIGGELLKFFMENSKKNRADDFLIAVFKNDPYAVNFFTKYGFSLKENFAELHRKV